MPKEEIDVHLWSALRQHAGGQEVVTVEANTVGELLDALARDWPGLADVIEQGVSVSVDSRVIASSLTEPVRSGQEVWLLTRITGG